MSTTIETPTQEDAHPHQTDLHHSRARESPLMQSTIRTTITTLVAALTITLMTLPAQATQPVTPKAPTTPAPAPAVIVATDATLPTETATVPVTSAAENKPYQARLEARRERKAAREHAAAARATKEAAHRATPAAPPPAGTRGAQAVAIAKTLIGTPYVYGGASPAGLDCSGLLVVAYAQLGISLPHQSGAILNAGTRLNEPEIGAIAWTQGHVSLCADGGCNTVIEAATPGTTVRHVPRWQNSPVYVRVTG